MSLTKCCECKKKFHSKRAARKHYREKHSGNIETPEEYLDRVESEQRDFEGNEPTTEGHNPEYEVTNDVPDSYMRTLRDYETQEDTE